jgi:hypothetical protein
MPNIFETVCDSKSFETLQQIRANFKAEQAEEEHRERERMVEHHKHTHIFDSYEQALDWLVEHSDRSIEWHCKTLSWLPEKNVYESFEQEYNISGVVSYDVTRYYSREQLLDGIKKHIQIMLSLYEGSYEEQYLDENGKLNYVEII